MSIPLLEYGFLIITLIFVALSVLIGLAAHKQHTKNN